MINDANHEFRQQTGVDLCIKEPRKLCVDGHEFSNEDSSWLGDGQFPPFAVFDIDAQENLLPFYATRLEAEQAMARLSEETNGPTTQLASQA